MPNVNFLTKFRAFQLDSPGSLFSFYKTGQYTLIEARIPKDGLDVLRDDLAYHNKERIDFLHITSWDSDHCKYDDLVQILNHFRPDRIEVPDYIPTTNDGVLCHSLIFKYDVIHQRRIQNVTVINKEYIATLPFAQEWQTGHIIYPSMFNCNNKNDMSLIKLFRSEGFNVLSLGDCESQTISDYLSQLSSIKKEVDVMILAHHGADNGFTTGQFIDIVKPKVVVCSSNNDNMYDHPAPAIRQLLSHRQIPLMTTKRGDVIIYETTDSPGATACNLISNNEIEDSRIGFVTKRIDHNIGQFTW